jgi:hypothetical protein
VGYGTRLGLSGRNSKGLVKIGQYSVRPSPIVVTEAIGMENNQEQSQSHEDREAQKLVNRIEKKQASQEAARAEDAKRTLEEYARKVGS